MTKSNSRLRQQCSKLCNIVVGVLSLAPCYVRKKQVQVVDQTTHPPKCHSFVGLDRQIGSSPPALLKGEKKEKGKKEKFYIYLDVTHTHTRKHKHKHKHATTQAAHHAVHISANCRTSFTNAGKYFRTPAFTCNVK